MSDSIWSDGGRIQMPQYEKLTRIKKVDVTIVAEEDYVVFYVRIS